MKNYLTSLALAFFLSTSIATAAQQAPIRITADLTDTSRHLFHAEIDLPVQSGPAAFTTPLWIPGSHSPNGPIGNIMGLTFSAGGRLLPWHRDDVVLSTFHLDVPRGISSIHVHLDAAVPTRATRTMAMLEWDTVMLYPAHVPVHDIAIEPSVFMPAGWGIGTALTPVKAGSTLVQYAVTNVEQLEDSPVLTGRYFHEYVLAPASLPPHFLDVAGDRPEDTVISPAVLQEMNNLIQQAGIEYASRHFTSYHFLVTRSDYAGGYGGLEHAQSTDIGIDRLSFTDPDHQLASADLFAHEYTHSWNGKYRRPAQLYQPDFATPVHGDLLWVYEGMTQYLGDVLATRSGLKSPEQFREMLALSAADLDNEPGRIWRSTEDTSVAVSILRGSALWANWRRGKDYYGEGELLWLHVDTLIRKLTQNKKSLDDFEALFLGDGGDTGPQIFTYDLAEIVTDLNSIVPYNWAAFLESRVSGLHPRADLDGLEQGGYKLVYKERPTRTEQLLSDPKNVLYSGEDFWYSLGLRVDDRGTLLDVRWKSPADQNTLAPRQTILTVNGAGYTAAALHQAIIASKLTKDAIRLTVRQEGESILTQIDYHEGERYPQLERSGDAPAYLDAIIQPRIPKALRR